MKIFFFFSILHELYGEVGKQIARQFPGTQLGGVLGGRDQLCDLIHRKFPTEHLHVFSSVLQRELPKVCAPLETVAGWEKRHGVLLSTILSTDRRYYKLAREQGLRVAAVAIRCCETWLDEFGPDVIIAEGINDLLSHVLYYSARDLGIPVLVPYASPQPGRVAIYGNAENRWEKVEEIFAGLRKRALIAKQRTLATTIVRDYREKHLLPSYLSAGYNRLIAGNEFRSLWLVARKSWLDTAHRLDPSYPGNVAEVIMHKAIRICRARIAAARYFGEPREGERFVFFPLQMEPECSTLAFAPFYANQLNVVECLAKSLPVDHLLYVKEHPVMVGRRALSNYRRIRAIPNVRLISPGVISHRLVRDASAVVTITSSVGWEAIVHAKPVIVLGNVWFNAFDLVEKIKSLSELPSAIARAISEFRPDDELLSKFVTASWEGTYPGEIEHPQYVPGVLAASNVALLADAICRHMNWLGLPLANVGDRSIPVVQKAPFVRQERAATRGATTSVS
ncbi:MAG: hypothetical protein ACRD50_10385 [Candidatus Acidiferrales bacterium]